MFCISEKDRGNLDKGFSYGIVLSDYDAEKMTFKGASKKQGACISTPLDARGQMPVVLHERNRGGCTRPDASCPAVLLS